MKKLHARLAAAALLVAPLMTARADIVLTTIADLTGQGLGTVQPLFTFQTPNGQTQVETGCYAYNNGLPGTGAYNGADNNPAGVSTTVGNYCSEGAANDVSSGSPKNHIYSLASLGISGTNEIGLVLNLNQVSNLGITIPDAGLVLSFYLPNPSGDVIFSAKLAAGWCNIAALCSGSNTFISSEQGQGSAGKVFVLNQAQQAALLAAMGGTFNPNVLVGASGFFGCAGTQTANCKEANDGADDVGLARVNASTITPEPASVALMATGLFGLVGVASRRRRK
jgi:hypothetical protein